MYNERKPSIVHCDHNLQRDSVYFFILRGILCFPEYTYYVVAGVFNFSSIITQLKSTKVKLMVIMRPFINQQTFNACHT